MTLEIPRNILALGLICSFFFSGCAGDASFEKVTGPTSPVGIAWMVAGGYAERLFPNSRRSFEVCFEDPSACAASGGYGVELSPAGRAALEYFKSMFALQRAAGQDSPQFQTDCQGFAARLFGETDAEAYEVAMRLLALQTADPQSPLRCAVQELDRHWQKNYDSRLVDWDAIKTTGYIELFLAGRWAAGKSSAFGHGLPGRGARLVAIAGSGVLVYKGAKGTLTMLELSRWMGASHVSSFVGKFNWLRKYRQPSILMARFVRKFAGFASDKSSP